MLAHLIAFITAVALCSGSALSQDHDVFRTIAQAYRAGDDDRCVRLTQYALYDKPDSSHIYYYINISSNYRIGNYDGCAAYASYIVPQDSFYLAARMIAHSISAREPGKVPATLIDTIAHVRIPEALDTAECNPARDDECVHSYHHVCIGGDDYEEFSIAL